MALFRIIGENPDVFDGEQFVRGIRMLYNYSSSEIERMKQHMDYWFRCYDDDHVLYFGVGAALRASILWILVLSMVVLLSNIKTRLRACGRFCDGKQ